MDERVPLEEIPLEVLQEFYRLRTQERLELEAKVRELRERLKEIEWITDGYHNSCPGCGGDEVHEDDCWLKKEIDELENG